MKFVRITYQECESMDGLQGAYRGVGIEQDIRLAEGWFDIADDYSAIEMDIVEGELVPFNHRRRRTRVQ